MLLESHKHIKLPVTYVFLSGCKIGSLATPYTRRSEKIQIYISIEKCIAGNLMLCEIEDAKFFHFSEDKIVAACEQVGIS